MSKSIKFGSGRTSTAFSREVNADAAPNLENVSQVTPDANCEHLNKTVATVRGVPYHDCPDCGSVLDWIPQPSEVERLRAINAQLIAALDQIRYIARNHWLDHRVTYPAIAEQFATITEAVNRALNAAEKESNK